MTDQPLVHASNPVFKVEGAIKGELARDLRRLEVEESTEGLKTLVARFLAAGPDADPTEGQVLHLDGGGIDFGKRLEVSLGPAGAERAIFDGRISAIEVAFEPPGEPLVSVHAEDTLMALRMTRRTRTWRDVSDAGLAREIAGLHSLTPAVDADGPTYDVVQQLDQSDLAFLRQRARLIGAELWADGRTLHFAARPKRTAPAVTLVQGTDLVSVRARADLAHQRTKVSVGGYDAGRQARIAEHATEDAVRAEVTSGRNGVALLQQAFGERELPLARQAPLAGEEARAWARAEMLRRARSFVTVAAVTYGTPDLVVGSEVTLQLVGRPFAGGGYHATRVRHTFDQSGHRTRFEAERPVVETA